MAKISKKQKQVQSKVKPLHLYPIIEAIELLQELKSTKFEESVDLSCNLGIDPRKSDQAVRFSVNLPKGLGKQVRVAVFAQGDNAEKAKAAGADIVGMQDLAAQIKAGELNFDVVIATPDTMGVVGTLGQILGPRGLMPNPKVGTVTTNVEAAITNAKAGQVRCKPDKNGIIHCKIGSINFNAKDIEENVAALVEALRKAKPLSAKGVYLKKITLSSTMGPGLSIDIPSIPV